MKRHWLFVLAFASLFLPPAARCQDDSTKAAPKPVYRVGVGVKPPREIYAPGPEYPKKARKEHQEGTVVLQMVVGSDGLPRDIKVARSLSPELDEAATVAVRQWKFVPATKDGAPVAVLISVEVSFHL
ncbi:MAG: energy transducer TonB [Terriglobales bacterium]|jgi:TonB family protein